MKDWTAVVVGRGVGMGSWIGSEGRLGRGGWVVLRRLG